MTRIERLAQLGYAVGVAYGAVETEEEALRQARALNQPERIEARAHSFASEAAAYARASGATGEVLVAMTARALAAATERLVADAADTIAFHERALAIAKESPTVYAVSGFGSQVHVAIDDSTGDGADDAAREMLDMLEAAAEGS